MDVPVDIAGNDRKRGTVYLLFSAVFADAKYIRSARRETKCDLVLKNAGYVDVFTGKIR